MSRPEIHAAIKDAMSLLDGTDAAVVSMMTGLSTEDIDALGGIKASVPILWTLEQVAEEYGISLDELR
jgi:hypothetical protein